MKKIFKFQFEGKEGFLSIVEKNNAYYALVQKDTPKIESIIKTHKLMIAFDIKNPVYQEVMAHVIFDQVLIKEVYDQLENEKNLYFKQLDDSLCVIEILKH